MHINIISMFPNVLRFWLVSVDLFLSYLVYTLIKITGRRNKVRI